MHGGLVGKSLNQAYHVGVVDVKGGLWYVEVIAKRLSFSYTDNEPDLMYR